MTDGTLGDVCPRCGSAAAVRSIQELADMARAQLGGQQPGGQPPGPAGQPGYAQEPQPGWAAEPQPGYGAQPQPGYGAQPQPGYGARQPQPGYGGQQPGWARQPRAGGSRGWRGGGSVFRDNPVGESIGEALGDDIAGAAMGMAARFLGRQIGRRVQSAMTDKVMPAVMARREDMLRQQIAIAERHPDLRACLTDKVVFLAGGSRVEPMPNLAGGFTVEQSDALVAGLRDG